MSIRKIIAILLVSILPLFGVGVYDTCITSGKWSVDANWDKTAKPTTADTVILKTGINDTADYDFNVIRYVSPAVTGTHWYNGRNDTVQKGFSLDGTGTVDLGNSLVMLGNGTLHWGAVGTETTTNLNLILGDAATDTITMDDDHGFTCKTITINGRVTNSGAVYTTFSSATTPFTMGNGAYISYTKQHKYILTASAAFVSLPASYTFTGTTAISFLVNTNSITATMPAFTGACPIIFTEFSAKTGWTIQLTGAFNNGATSNLDIYIAEGNGTGTFDANGQNITCGAFRVGLFVATGTTAFTMKYGSGTHNFTSYSGTTYNASGTGTFTEQFQGSTINCLNNWTGGSNHSVSVDSFTLNITGISTVTANGKPFWNFNINSPNNIVQLADSIPVNNDFKVIQGNFDMKAKSLRCKNFIDTSDTDVVDLSGKLYVSKNVKFCGACVLNTNDTNYIRLDGTDSCKYTSDGYLNKYVLLKGTNTNKIMELQDSFNVRIFLDSIGQFRQNNKGIRCSTFVAAGSDSIVLNRAYEITKNLSFGLDVKENITGTTIMQGGTSGTLTLNGNTIAALNISKSGTAGVTVSTSGRAGDVTVADGNLWVNGGDSMQVGTLTANNSNDSIARIGTGTAYIVVTGDFTTAADVKWDRANIRIIMAGAGGMVTLNGNDNIPTIQANASMYINVGGNSLVGGLVFGNDNIGVSVRAGDTLVLAAMANADWTGAAGSLDSLFSATPGSRFYISWPGNPAISYAYLRDVCFSPGTLTCPWTSGCRSGGGNRCP